jgi:hypothetical protein
MDRIFANECGNLDVHMGVFLWLLFLDEQNFGNEYGNVDVMSVLMGVFFMGTLFGWTEILQ